MLIFLVDIYERLFILLQFATHMEDSVATMESKAAGSIAVWFGSQFRTYQQQSDGEDGASHLPESSMLGLCRISRRVRYRRLKKKLRAYDWFA